MPLEIIRNDITKVSADAIVNTANPEVTYGAGVDSSIYIAAGAEELLAERAKIGPMTPGSAAVTPALHLDAKYIIHTIGPVWQGGDYGEAETVAACYRKSLALAKEKACESVAFPLIATGTYGFPKDLALRIAISEIGAFLLENDMTVYIVVYDRDSFVLSGKLFSEITEYIKENEVLPPAAHRRRFGTAPVSNAPFDAPVGSATIDSALPKYMLREDADYLSPSVLPVEEIMEPYEDEEPDELQELAAPPADDLQELAAPPADDASVEEKLKKKAPTFQQHLLRIIDLKGLKDSEVYHKANIDRKHFSKIKNNVDYNPSKRTALAFAVALELSLDETLDLLGRAGMTLSRSSEFDIIMEYCFENHITDIMEINCILFEYQQPLLGA